jgi:molecular chaperone HtpG
MKAGNLKVFGSTISLHFNEDSADYAKESKITEILERYCNFMMWPIMFKDKQVNLKEALWNRNPKDVKPEEYQQFYKDIFHDYKDPVFWIHLNVDFPFNLKGILYFPRLRNEPDYFKGEVKLFCNNVFVADNLEDLIPEFLLLLKGGIDIPDIPSTCHAASSRTINRCRRSVNISSKRWPITLPKPSSPTARNMRNTGKTSTPSSNTASSRKKISLTP